MIDIVVLMYSKIFSTGEEQSNSQSNTSFAPKQLNMM